MYTHKIDLDTCQQQMFRRLLDKQRHKVDKHERMKTGAKSREASCKSLRRTTVGPNMRSIAPAYHMWDMTHSYV